MSQVIALDNSAKSMSASKYKLANTLHTTYSKQELVIEECNLQPFLEYMNQLGEALRTMPETFQQHYYERMTKKKKEFGIFLYIFNIRISTDKEGNSGYCQYSICKRYTDVVKTLKICETYLKKKKIPVVPWKIPSHKKNPQGNCSLFRARIAYLCDLLKLYNEKCEELYDFLELSTTTTKNFIPKYKEGYLKKRRGGLYQESNFKKFGALLCILCLWEQKWLIVCKEGILYGNKNTTLNDRPILLFDNYFRIEYGRETTGSDHAITLITQNRIMRLWAPNYFESAAWLLAIHRARSECEFIKSLKERKYMSFAPIRKECDCQWYVDGEDYYKDVYQAMNQATKEIFISDWFFSLEFFLLRPVRSDLNQDSRLDKTLERAAKRGVKVFIILFKENPYALPNDSFRVKTTLEALHSNIHVARHPTQLISYWSHHEKMVVIDQKLAFMGGLDLCFARMDNSQHLLFDPEYLEKRGDFWPGQDYSNLRVKDFVAGKDPFQSLISKDSVPRLPWHDIAMRAQGPVVKDVARHFIQFWNFTKLMVDPKNVKQEYLMPEQDVETIKKKETEMNIDSGSKGRTSKRSVSSFVELKTFVKNIFKKNNNTTIISEKSNEESGRELTIFTSKPKKNVDNFGSMQSSNSRPKERQRASSLVASDLHIRNAILAQSITENNRHEEEKKKEEEKKEEENREENNRINKSDFLDVPEERNPISLEISYAKPIRESIKMAVISHSKNPQTEQIKDTIPANFITEPVVGDQVACDINSAEISNDLERKSPKASSNNVIKMSVYKTKTSQDNHFLTGSVALQDQNMNSKKSEFINLIAKAIELVNEEEKDEIMIPNLQSPENLTLSKKYGTYNDQLSPSKDAKKPLKQRIMDFVLKKIPSNDGKNSSEGKEKSPRKSKSIEEAARSKISYVDEPNLMIQKDAVQGTCTCQMVRSASSWSLGLSYAESEASIQIAYLEIIRKSKYFIYIENQFFISKAAGAPVSNLISEALILRIKEAFLNREKFKVIVFLPLLPGFEGDIATTSVLRVQLHWQYSTISRGGQSILEVLRRDHHIPNPEDYISFYSLRTHAKVRDTPYTEMVYIHSKLMIVDDRIVILGSANINDRSLLGKRDSEIGMVTEDTQTMSINMNGKPYKANRFAHTLRTRLFVEHLGMTYEEVEDPLNDDLLNSINLFASSNTEIYRKIFRCIPDNNVTHFDQIANFQSSKNLLAYDELTKMIKGHVVEFPKNFLRDEDLRFRLLEKEYLFLPEKSITQ